MVAAIMMIAAFVVPFAAQAHAGHHEPTSATFSAFDAVFAPGEALFRAELPRTALASEDNPIHAVTKAAPGSPSPNKACTGSCCCNTGAACCAHAVLANEGGAAPTGVASRTSAILDDLGRPSFDAEAIPEPPKTFV